MRSLFKRFLATLVVCSAAPLLLHADDLHAKRDKPVEIDKAIEAPAKDVLQYFSEIFGVIIEVDARAFATEKLNNPEELKHLVLHKMPVAYLDSVLQCVLWRTQAVYEIRGDKIVIVPNRSQGKPRAFPPFTEAQLKAQGELKQRMVKSTVEIERDLKGSFKGIWCYVEDRFEIPIIIGSTHVENVIYYIPTYAEIQKGKYTFDELLSGVLDQVDARYEVLPDHIRMVDKPKK